MKLFLVLAFSAVVLSEFSETTDYCSADLCLNGLKHIACGNNGSFAITCPRNAVMEELDESVILLLHNENRDKIASGKLRGFKPARRMATMKWSPELAKFAEYNVKQCVIKHDACRNTKKFKYAGQNLAYYQYTGDSTSKTNEWLITNLLHQWWTEYPLANMQLIDSYDRKMGRIAGHFTLMVTDRNDYIGCAAARYTNEKLHTFLLACNYASTNIIGHPVYESGEPGSGCATGRNPEYNALCDVPEPYRHH